MVQAVQAVEKTLQTALHAMIRQGLLNVLHAELVILLILLVDVLRVLYHV